MYINQSGNEDILNANRSNEVSPKTDNPSDESFFQDSQSKTDSKTSEDTIKAASFHESNSKVGNQKAYHTVELISTAIPYLNGRPKKSMNMMLKAVELLDSYHDYEYDDELSACDFNETEVDTKSMLLDLKKVCSDKERELLDIMINYITAQKIFNTYKTMANINTSSSDNNFSNYAKGFGFSNNSNSNTNTLDLLESLLPPEQKSSFENIKMMMNAMNVN